MLTKFKPQIGAAFLLVLGALYSVIALASGHSATAEPPPDLAAKEAGVDVWRATALLLGSARSCVADSRDKAQFELYHLPGAVPASSAGAIAEACRDSASLLVVAETDEAAAKLCAELEQKQGGKKPIHFLRGGAPSFYLALELPVPLFADKPPPHGYAEARAEIRRWLAGQGRPSAEQLQKTLGVLIRADYQPTKLSSRKKPAPAKKKKKITGGCG